MKLAQQHGIDGLKQIISTNQLPYDYDPSARCPNFEAFLYDVFENDEERVKLIQQILGYIWLREIKIQKAFIFFGNGSNGKSVLANVMQHLYGEKNISSTPLSIYLKNIILKEPIEVNEGYVSPTI